MPLIDGVTMAAKMDRGMKEGLTAKLGESGSTLGGVVRDLWEKWQAGRIDVKGNEIVLKTPENKKGPAVNPVDTRFSGILVDLGCTEEEFYEGFCAGDYVVDRGIGDCVIRPTDESAAQQLGVEYRNQGEYIDALFEFTSACVREKVDAVSILNTVVGEVHDGEWARPTSETGISGTTLKDIEQMVALTGGTLGGFMDDLREKLNSGALELASGKIVCRAVEEEVDLSGIREYADFNRKTVQEVIDKAVQIAWRSRL